MNRRLFIGSLASLGCLGFLEKAEASPLLNMAAKASKKQRTDGIDPDLVVFITDIHIKDGSFQTGRFKRVVSDILAMRPLPQNVIALGDLAYHTGKVEEYELFKPMIAPLSEAGIHVTLGMGNHDRREEFAQVFPEHAALTKLNGRYVYVVEHPKADIIVLDSLQQGDDKTKWISPGDLGEEQKLWLQETLSSYTKPVFVCAHHPITELGIDKILCASPTCCGYLYGHNHKWRKDWAKLGWHHQRIVRTLCLPSTGQAGDIGYVTFRLMEDRAVAQIHEYEFFFPEPASEGTIPPPQWKMIVEENDRDICVFSYDTKCAF